MMNVISTLINFSIAYYLLFCVRSALSAFTTLKEANLGEYYLKRSNDLELKPMFSVNYDTQINQDNSELKEFYDKYDFICGSCLKKYTDLLRTVNNYVQRYVSLFLIIIFDEEGKNSSEMITVDLEITISREDLAYLQDFSKESEKSSGLRDLSKLEAILSRVVKRKERSYLERIFSFSISLLYYLGQGIYRFLLLSNFHHFIPFLTILLVTYFIYRFSPRKSFYVYLGIIINSMIFWDGLNLYRKKIKDVEIELETLKLRKMPAECDPANVKWYHSVINIFGGDKCLEYNKNVNRNPMDEVSLFQCIVDMYSFHTVQAAFRVLGASIRDFTGEVSALWPTPLRWIISLPLLPFFIVVVMFLILILFGKRLKLSFFGASVEIGESTVKKEIKKINKTGPRQILSYRPLRVPARSRFFRHSELDLAKEKKFSLKASKSDCVIKNKNEEAAKLLTASDSEIGKNKTDVF